MYLPNGLRLETDMLLGSMMTKEGKNDFSFSQKNAAKCFGTELFKVIWKSVRQESEF